MSITSTWIVDSMNCYPQLEGQTNVVFSVCWRVNATQETYSSTAYGVHYVNYVSNSAFTPYLELTQDQVVLWVKNNMGDEKISEIENKLAQEIENQINPPVVNLSPPWTATT